MSLKQFFSVLLARIWLIAGIFGAVMVAVVVASLFMTPRYTATSQVLVDVKSPDPVAGSVLPAHLLSSYIATQVELLTSERVALRVVRTLKLHERPEWVEQYQSREGAADVSPEMYVAKSLLKGVKVRPSMDANLLEISFSSGNRTEVSAIANGFVKAYVDEVVDIRVAPARETRAFFEAQAAQYRTAFQTAQARLSEFRASRGITTTDERDDIENARLQQLQAQLTEVQAGRIESTRRGEAAATALRGGSSAVSDVLGNPLIQSLKSELARAEARLQDRSAALGSNHPEILRLREEVQSLSDRLSKETTAIVQSLARNAAVASQREAELSAELRRQRSLVLSNKQARETIQMLQRDVDVAQRAYDSLVQKATQASLESQATQANITVIAAAVTPALPSSPNIPLNLAIGLTLGSMLGVLAALLAESFRGRIRFEEDLAQVTGAPVAGALGVAPVRMIRGEYKPALARMSGSGARAVRAEPAMPGISVRPTASDAGVSERGTNEVADILVDRGLLSPAQAAEVAAAADEQGLPFGEAAVATGRVSSADLSMALSVHSDFPLLDPATSQVSRQVVAAYDVDHPFMDDLRILRTHIKAQLRSSQSSADRALAIVSQDQGDGKTFTAANLAVSFAQLGDRTLLVDGDMRQGQLHRLFALPNAAGLSTVLSMESRVRDALNVLPGMPNLTVLTAGPEVASPSDLLASSTTEKLFELFSRTYDIVIIDTPSAAGRPDATLLASAAKNYVIVARRHRSLTRAVHELSRKLEGLGAKMIGSVLVKA